MRARTGVVKPNKILNLTIVKYPTGLGYESYYDFYLYVNLGSIRPAAILTSLVKLGCGRNSGGRKGCDKNNWNADWLPSFDDTKIIVAKGVAWGLKIPFIENDATDAGAMALESQYEATGAWDGNFPTRFTPSNGGTPTPDKTWLPMSYLDEFKAIAGDGIYITSTVTFQPDTMLGKVISFPAKIAGKCDDDDPCTDELTKSSELFLPIFNSGEILSGTTYKITTPGSCFGASAPVFTGQDYNTWPKDPKDGATQTKCYPTGFLVQMDERYFEFSGFKPGEDQSAKFKMTNVAIAMPVTYLRRLTSDAGQPSILSSLPLAPPRGAQPCPCSYCTPWALWPTTTDPANDPATALLTLPPRFCCQISLPLALPPSLPLSLPPPSSRLCSSLPYQRG